VHCPSTPGRPAQRTNTTASCSLQGRGISLSRPEGFRAAQRCAEHELRNTLDHWASIQKDAYNRPAHLEPNDLKCEAACVAGQQGFLVNTKLVSKPVPQDFLTHGWVVMLAVFCASLLCTEQTQSDIFAF
jgi:hypothetical protein